MSDQERLDLARAAAGGCVKSARRLLAMLERSGADTGGSITCATRLQDLPRDFFAALGYRGGMYTRSRRAIDLAYILMRPTASRIELSNLTVGDVARTFSHDFLLYIQGCGPRTVRAIEAMCVSAGLGGLGGPSHLEWSSRLTHG